MEGLAARQLVKSNGAPAKLVELRALKELLKMDIIRHGYVVSQFPETAQLANSLELAPWWMSSAIAQFFDQTPQA